MAYFADLTPYAYSHTGEEIVWREWGELSYRPRYERRNVGWLAAPHPFEQGPVPAWFAGALLDIIDGPAVNECRGLHECEFCPPGTGPIAHPRPSRNWLAYYEIRVPAEPGVMFAAPSLIWHYVTAHDYRPPTAFVEAVRRYDAGWAAEPSPWIPPDAERDLWDRTGESPRPPGPRSTRWSALSRRSAPTPGGSPAGAAATPGPPSRSRP
ncbi:hypothetical protein ABT369_52420 [Dactylosporangium sp. NPDC000244]|uniref:DUF7919 family protein n=1 Tax=Dactylosporangium sp. NPDC000244 TaxID=3154365 RepID=UPI0033300156